MNFIQYESNIFKSTFSKLKRQFYIPVFSNILRQRWLVFLLVSVVIVHLAVSSFGYEIWRCPIKSTFGIPCPGCGLSSAIISLLQGKWKTAFLHHAFAGIFLIGFTVAIGVSLLPFHDNKMVVNWISKFERCTGLFTYLMMALMIYWIMRLSALF